jgi:hypothetical protein
MVSMKKLKVAKLWAVDCLCLGKYIQMYTYKKYSDAKKIASTIDGALIVRRECVTDKY